jgi:inner membrane protein
MQQGIKKIFTVGAMALAMSFALFCIHGLIGERRERKQSVLAELAGSTPQEQRLAAPEIWCRTQATPKDELLFAVHATSLVAKSVVTPNVVHRGIFSVPLFVDREEWDVKLDMPAALSDRAAYQLTSAELVFGVGDTRGLQVVPVVTVNGKPVEVKSGTAQDAASAFAVTLAVAEVRPGAHLNVHVTLELAGSSRVGYINNALQAEYQMQSVWKDPSFYGAQLPAERNVSKDGFSALWRTNAFQSRREHVEQVGSFNMWAGPEFGVNLFDSVDMYTQADRATKYGFLFIGLTFAGLGLVELRSKRAIHVIQYGLVGVAISIFFLLLLSLSEHIAFAAAYAVATAACSALIGYYGRHVLASKKGGAVFAASTAALYGLLFVLLRLEDFALLLGSGVLFAALGVAMYVTRKLEAPPMLGADAAAVLPPANALMHNSAVPYCPLSPRERPADCVQSAPYRD